MKFLIMFFSFLVCNVIQAQEIPAIVLTLNAGESYPTAEQVREDGSLNPPPVAFILSSFNTYPPMKVEYLVKLRAYGELKDLIDSKPNWGKSQLERSLIISYDESTNLGDVVQTMNADSDILTASIIEPSEIHANNSSFQRGSLDPNWHLNAINWANAPNNDSGFGHLGYVDIGAPTNRVEFEPFDSNNNQYLGGGLNLNQSFTSEYGDRIISDLRAIDYNEVNDGDVCDLYDAVPNDGIIFPSAKFAGHGNHVSGLLIANSLSNSGVCPSCNLSGTSEFIHYCREEVQDDGDPSDSKVFTTYSLLSWSASLQYLVDTGRQSINMSFGRALANDVCYSSPQDIACSVISDAKARNITLVASAGNFRSEMRFPAFDRDVIGVGGIDSSLQFWNQSPTNGNPLPPLDPNDFINQDTSNCPWWDDPNRRFQECGSNYSNVDQVAPGVFEAERYRRIDIVAPAQDVVSSLPLGSEYNSAIGDFGCTDMSDGVLDGFGPCTGTSMSAPIVTGITQLIRSANPLLPIGDDDPSTLDGIRDVLLYSGSIYQSTGEHDPWMGFGIPDTQLAVETVLGVSNGQKMKNRVTPLMVLHNDDFNDTAYTTFTQIALSYALNPSGFYETPLNIPEVNELDNYPVEEVDGLRIVDMVPLAPAYVFTT